MVAADYDVAIVGYGPTGATLANLLGAEGLRVLVLERDLELFDRARAVSTDEEVMRVWQRTGLADRLLADMVWGLPLTFVDSAGRTFLQFTPAPRGNGYPTQLFLFQPALEQVLRDGVARYRTVDVRLGVEVVDVVEVGDLVRLVAAGGQEWTASYVVAADGGSSPVRGLLGVGFTGRTYAERWVVVDATVRRRWPEVDRLRFHCDPVRPAVDCPTPLGHHRWEFPVQAGDSEAELVSEAGVRRLLAGVGRSADEVDVQRAVVYSHHVRVAARWRVGRVFLAGDAAHVMPPYIGQGMSAGVRDAGNLAWKLAAVVRGELPADVLDSYQVERMPHVRSVSDAAVFFGRVITERRPWVVAVRDPLFRMALRTPGVGAFLRGGSWFPPAHLARGLHAGAEPSDGVVARLADRVRGLVGRLPLTGGMLPQPEVLDETGARVRFDDAVGRRWALVQLSDGVADPRWTCCGVPVLRVVPAGGQPRPGVVVDVDDVLVPALRRRGVGSLGLRRRGVDSLVLRPDGVVYTAAAPGEQLAAPPPGLRLGGGRSRLG